LQGRQTPLICAVKNENIVIVRAILSSKGVNVTWKDRLEHSAYDYAKTDEFKNEIYSYMLENEDMIDPTIKKGKSYVLS
jgi:ankyrin repeat protein